MKKTILLIALFGVLFGYGLIIAAKQDDSEDRGPLTKITFIHYKNNNSRAGGVKVAKTTCYDFLASGAKWKTTEDYTVYPFGSGAEESLVLGAVAAGVAEWEKYGGNEIFGSQMAETSAYGSQAQYDGTNVVYFGEYPDDGVIAVTTVWGYFGGAPKTRELVEWDMQFNTFYQWGDAQINPGMMDLQNIATHELGHSAGMDDLYNTSCNSETMFGYSNNGEISKRDLGKGDILGIQTLY